MKTSKLDFTLIHKRFPYTVFLLLTWLILIIPLIDTKIIPGHDYVFHVSRILNIADGLQDGVFPLRIYADEMIFWGAPVGMFYPSLFLYFPALLKVTGVPIEICYNLFISFIFLAGTFSSWLGFSLLTRSKKKGLFAALFFISSGYYLSDAYIRSAVGELLGLSFMPLAAACIQAVITKSRISKKIYILGVLSVSAVIQSHVLSCYFLVLFALVNLVFKYKTITTAKFYRFFLFSLVLLLLNANFIFPFVLFYKTVPVFIDYVENFSQNGWPTKILTRFLVLWNFCLLVAICLFICIFTRNPFTRLNLQKRYLKAYFPVFISGIVFLFMSDNIFPWDILLPLKKMFEILQFPWRLLGISTMCFSACAALAVEEVFRKKRYKNSMVFLIMSFICIVNVITFNHFTPLPSSAQWQMPAKIYWDRKQSPSYSDYNLYKDMDINEFLRQGNNYLTSASIGRYNKKGTNISFSYNAKENTVIVLPLINYPGYAAADQSGQKIKIEENDNHMISIKLPKGTGTIKVWYEGLFLYTVADYLSILSAIVFIVFINHRRAEDFFCLSAHF